MVKALPSEGRDFPGSKPGRATKLWRVSYAGVRESVYRRSSNLRVCRFESDRRHQCARSPIGRGGRLKPGLRAGSNPAARTTGDMTRLEERRTPNPFLQGSNPWSPPTSSHRKLIGEAAACSAAHGEFDSHRCSTAGAGGWSATGLECRRSARMGVRFLRPRPQVRRARGCGSRPVWNTGAP